MLWQLLEEDVAGSMQDQYVWSRVDIDALIERDTPTQRMYVEQNPNFDVTSLVDTTGNVQERYIYDPYGSVTILAADWTTRGSSNYGWVYFHQGGRYDFATGLYAFRNRDYSPALGRWVQTDPVGVTGGETNLYRAYSDNPTTSTDPLGLQAKPRPKPGKPKPKPGGGDGLIKPGGVVSVVEDLLEGNPASTSLGCGGQLTVSVTAEFICPASGLVRVTAEGGESDTPQIQHLPFCGWMGRPKGFDDTLDALLRTLSAHPARKLSSTTHSR
jgi:RHS repeat-associated protein